MILDFETVKAITAGAVAVKDEADGIHFYRMSEAERALYIEKSPDDFAYKALCTSGIRLSLVTDATEMTLEVLVKRSASRKYYAIDVAVDGERIGSIDNIDPSLRHPIGINDFEGEERRESFSLGEGEKTVSIYLPWSMDTVLRELSLEGGNMIKVAPRVKKLLAYGDSITHGYDAEHPMEKYITRVADALGADEYNKGIGGEIFFPELSEIKQEFTPDLITVAYGTNDWGKGRELDDFIARCKQFYTNLRENYPDTPIYAITPIWRYGGEEERAVGTVKHVGELIGECVEGLGITVIDGYGLVPEDRTLFADLRLHPNSHGFEYYSAGVLDALAASERSYDRPRASLEL